MEIGQKITYEGKQYEIIWIYENGYIEVKDRMKVELITACYINDT
jgi:hypothetical protein